MNHDPAHKTNGLLGWLNSLKGVLAFVVAGGVGGMWVLENRLRATIEANAAQIETLDRKTDWIICASIPPYRADVLAALRVRCEFAAEIPQMRLYSDQTPPLPPLPVPQ